MFKKSLFLGCVLATSMAAGLMGMTTTRWDTNGDTTTQDSTPSTLSKVASIWTKYAEPYVSDTTNLEAATAVARAYLTLSEANTKKPGRIKLTLLDLARITNEWCSYKNINKNPQLNKNPQQREQQLLMILDILSLCKHVVAGKTKPSGDNKLKGIAKLLDTKILPGLEAIAAVIRAASNVANARADHAGKGNFALKIVQKIPENSDINYWCTFTIISARLFSMMVESGIGSKTGQLELLAAVIYGLKVLSDKTNLVEIKNYSSEPYTNISIKFPFLNNLEFEMHYESRNKFHDSSEMATL